MTKLNLNEATIICNGGRGVTVEFANARGEWAKDFPSILSAKEWCAANGLKVI